MLKPDACASASSALRDELRTPVQRAVAHDEPHPLVVRHIGRSASEWHERVSLTRIIEEQGEPIEHRQADVAGEVRIGERPLIRAPEQRRDIGNAPAAELQPLQGFIDGLWQLLAEHAAPNEGAANYRVTLVGAPVPRPGEQ
jgi:hypothetical protein